MATENLAERIDAALAAMGHTSFRPGQREAVETLLEKGRLLLVAPTGGGKSLTYQLPASILEGTSLVVSPLIALMADQVEALTAKGIPSTYLSSTLSPDEFRSRMDQIRSGRYRLVYVSPERVTFPGFRGLLRDLAPPLIAIDEAHCISAWGHDFRPEYLRIGEILADCPASRVLACTATATPVVRDEILARLGLGEDTPQILRGFARPNLALRVHDVQGRNSRGQAVDAMLREALGEPRRARGTAIVYAPTRNQTEEEADRLAGCGWRVTAYHAGLKASQRNERQQRFMDGELEVVVATNAFGMGIDRSDVRAVIHLGPPGSIEAYYQEVGRAGRDGERAWGLLLTSAQDFPRRRQWLLNDPNLDQETAEHKWQLFLELMRWAQGGSCRHDGILRYFDDEGETLAGCGICDVCERLDDPHSSDAETITLYVRKALSGVARIHDRFGLGAAVALLKGKSDARLERSRLTEVSTFGVLREEPEPWIMDLLQRCVTAGWVDFRGADRPVAVLTEAGVAVMKAERPARLVLPPRGRASRGPSAAGQRRGAPEELGDAAAQARFETLRAWRTRVAKQEGVPAYVVASDRTLRDVALLCPRNRDELLMAHGIGPAKLEKYGGDILSVLRESGEA